ncbi:MAG: 50S ribosomal protein L1, partial [Bacilli bacterium]
MGGFIRLPHKEENKVAKTSKKYQEALKLVDRDSSYEINEAIELAKKTSTVKFDATVEAAFRL